MPRLTTLKPRITTAPNRLQAVPTGIIERKRGTTGVNDRNAIKQRDYGICQQCKREGRTALGAVVDHIVPLHQGGSDESTNKELLCTPCHDTKTSRESGDRGGSSY